MDEETIKKYEEMREYLLTIQAKLEMASKAISDDVNLISNKITVLRTEILSLINSERKDKEVD